jgi:UPF0271 protein
MEIDLNADVGEGFGPWPMGDDDHLVPLVSSVNVACGLHAGDPATIERTVRLAVAAGVAVGAHPGYPDLAGFGRRELKMPAAELEATILYQVGAVAAFARDAGVDLHHVKPHGALYNAAARDVSLASVVARAVRRWSRDAILYGLAGSALIEAGQAAGLQVAAEAFPDRAYEPDGTLRPRSLPDAVLTASAAIADRAVAMARDRRIVATDGTSLTIEARTLCLHGDTPGAAAHAAAVRRALAQAGIAVRPVAGTAAPR